MIGLRSSVSCGYGTRLEAHTEQYTGRRILNLQATLALLHSPVAMQTQSLPDPQDESQPFTHPALEGLANLGDVQVTDILTKKRLARLATQMGMPEIMRWKPRNVRSFHISLDAELTMYSRKIWKLPALRWFLRRRCTRWSER